MEYLQIFGKIILRFYYKKVDVSSHSMQKPRTLWGVDPLVFDISLS